MSYLCGDELSPLHFGNPKDEEEPLLQHEKLTLEDHKQFMALELKPTFMDNPPVELALLADAAWEAT